MVEYIPWLVGSGLIVVGGPKGPISGNPFSSPRPVGRLPDIVDLLRISASLVELINVNLANSCSGLTAGCAEVIMFWNRVRNSFKTGNQNRLANTIIK